MACPLRSASARGGDACPSCRSTTARRCRRKKKAGRAGTERPRCWCSHLAWGQRKRWGAPESTAEATATGGRGRKTCSTGGGGRRREVKAEEAQRTRQMQLQSDSCRTSPGTCAMTPCLFALGAGHAGANTRAQSRRACVRRPRDAVARRSTRAACCCVGVGFIGHRGRTCGMCAQIMGIHLRVRRDYGPACESGDQPVLWTLSLPIHMERVHLAKGKKKLLPLQASQAVRRRLSVALHD